MNIGPIIYFIEQLAFLYCLALFVHIILTWLLYFDILNRNNNVVYKVNEVLFRITDPALRFIRRYLPNLNGIDISPIILLLLIQLVVGMLKANF